MKESTLSLTHPIIFVMDFENPNVTIPEYADEIVASTSSCVSVRALVDIDGETTVRMTSSKQESPPKMFACVFEGAILTPSRKIAAVTSENMKLMESDVSAESARVRISVNRTDFPDVIFIEVEPD